MWVSKSVLSLLVLASFGICLISGDADLSYSQLLEFKQRTSALKYGDPCSWEHEKHRLTFTKDLASTKMTTDYIKDFVSDTLWERRNYCDAHGLYICSKKTQTCTCGDPGFVVFGSGTRRLKSRFATELVYGEVRCRWREGQYCAMDKNTAATCARGTSCISKSKGTCDKMGMLLHFLQNPNLSAEGRMKEVFSGRICSCQRDVSHIYNYSAPPVSKEQLDSWSRTRAKRSLNDLQTDDILSAISGPTAAFSDRF